MNSPSIIKCAALALPTLLLCNCATIFGGANKKEVTLLSNPTGATVTVTNKTGTLIHKGVTPTAVALDRSNGFFVPSVYHLEFSKKGFPTQRVDLNAKMNPWYIGNIAFGGLIGLLIVDPATGAMWTLDSQYSAQLGPIAKTQSANQLTVIERSRIPKEWESHLVAVK